MIQARLANADLIGDVLKAEAEVRTGLNQILGDSQYPGTSVGSVSCIGVIHLPTIR